MSEIELDGVRYVIGIDPGSPSGDRTWPVDKLDAISRETYLMCLDRVESIYAGVERRCQGDCLSRDAIHGREELARQVRNAHAAAEPWKRIMVEMLATINNPPLILRLAADAAQEPSDLEANSGGRSGPQQAATSDLDLG